MISTKDYKKVRISITTLKHRHSEIKENAMNDTPTRNYKQNKYICSMCLNTKPTEEKNITENDKRKPKACPVCERSNVTQTIPKTETKKESPSSKVVQTSQTDVTQGLNLLNEVLTVFQSKKQLELKEKSVKTVICKDASVATDFYSKGADLRPKLSLSKIFQFSIDENPNRDNNKFMIVSSCQPDVGTKSQYSINLRKHKSSSIPQMKMEELKNSFKEKTKSKDAIEEVNRMFATVRRNYRECADDTNRPMIRHGPRVLPLVKTNHYENVIRRDTISDENFSQCYGRRQTCCKCCQTNNYFMSGGDSIECCHKQSERKEKCDKSVYMLCCQYDDRNKLQTGVMFCECCGKNREYYKKECNKECVDSATSF